MKHKRYLVTGKRQYRWHEPGSIFEARLDSDAERRAIERGSIRVLEEVEVKVESFDLPDDWPHTAVDTSTESPAGVSRVN